MADKKLTPDEVKRNLLIVGCIRLWLDYKGVKQEHLANKLDVSKGAVSKWLSGQTNVSSQNLAKIAEILDIPLADLFFQPGQSPRTPAYDQAATLLGNLSAEDVQRWLTFGEALRSTKPEDV